VSVLEDSATSLRWSRKVSGEVSWEQAGDFCRDQGPGWRLPSRKELESQTQPTATGDARELRGLFKGSTPRDGVLFSGELVPRLDKGDHHPWVMRIQNGHVFNGHGYSGYVRCVQGEPVAVAEPKPLTPQGWWSKVDPCPDGAAVEGTPGTLVYCVAADGQRHGRYTRWFRGKRTDRHFDSGKVHGTTTYFHADGSKHIQGENVRGKHHGTWITWNENGDVVELMRYDMGRTLESQRFASGKPIHGDFTDHYAGGQLKSKGHYDHGHRTGLWEEYYPNGTPKASLLYDDKGRLHGLARRWNEDGSPFTESTWKNGALHGDSILWSHRGEKVVRRYQDGAEMASPEGP
jgi:antitoxin component YwqK of YwqJK toxin-antitoxin module